jgi:Kef-type K+ transport system membrane component KefB
MFLLVAGMEVDLSRVRRRTKAVVSVGATGMALPFILGLAAAWYLPTMLGRPPGVSAVFFALFFATALSISALPVIAKILLDLDLYHSDVGTIVIAAAMINDLASWIIFGVLLATMHGTSAVRASDGIHAVLLTLTFAALMVTVGRWLIDAALRWILRHDGWLGSVTGFTAAIALVGGAVAEAIGSQALFGAFLVGVAVGNSAAMRPQDRNTITQFVASVFAPLFFVSLGLRANVIANFDVRVVAMVMAIACAGKILGVGFGARLARLDPRQGWAVAFGLNARGAMQIVLSLLALQRGLIQVKLFVALVLMALVTSMMSGPLMQGILGLKPRRLLADVPDSPQVA